MIKTDYLIVGAGLTGSTIARQLANAGREVFVVERRNHIGGNVYDYTHSSGLSVHAYGPHYFRTSSEEIWKFVNRFTAFYPYQAIVKCRVEGIYENWPVSGEYIASKLGEHWEPDFKGTPANFEDSCLAMMPRLIYEKFIRGYSEKQWGKAPTLLSRELAGRFHVRIDNDPRLVQHNHQGIPVNGYTAFIKSMLSGIPQKLDCDYLKCRDLFSARKKLIYTGPIDEFFSFQLGNLAYRGQRREDVFQNTPGYAQVCGQVNYPALSDGPYIRTLEWKHMMRGDKADAIRGTLITKETPFTPQDPDQYEYPFADNENLELYRKYETLARSVPKLVMCGRLGQYQYLDMDKAIERALALSKELLAEK